VNTNIQVSKAKGSGNTHEICDKLCFSFPVLSLVTLAHVRLAKRSAQSLSGLHVFLGFEVKLSFKKIP